MVARFRAGPGARLAGAATQGPIRDEWIWLLIGYVKLMLYGIFTIQSCDLIGDISSTRYRQHDLSNPLGNFCGSFCGKQFRVEQRSVLHVLWKQPGHSWPGEWQDALLHYYSLASLLGCVWGGLDPWKGFSGPNLPHWTPGPHFWVETSFASQKQVVVGGRASPEV